MKNIKEKILIIGAKGMLGQELVSVFRRDKEYEVFAWDKDEIDITKEKDIKSKIGELKPAIIINAAAYNAVDKCEQDKKEFALAQKLNGEAPGYLAKAAKKIGATLVHYSTDYVFDGQPDIPEPEGCAHVCASCNLHETFQPPIGFAENSRPNPISKYGKSKLLGEKEVRKNTKKYYLIRLSKLFGHPGASEGAKRSFFDVMLEVGSPRFDKMSHRVEAGKKNKIVKVVDEETSCFTYAPDLARKTKEMIDAKKTFGIYHIVNSDPCTWYEAVLELYRMAKIKVKVVPVLASEFPRPAKRPYFSVLLNTKLNPLRSYKEALKEYLGKK
ncbi:MAG TPA: NAD(P)-dependent oxidoreductase [Patescibacteria group bacterium]